jgi:hypothetical protein
LLTGGFFEQKKLTGNARDKPKKKKHKKSDLLAENSIFKYLTSNYFVANFSSDFPFRSTSSAGGQYTVD